MMKRMLALFLTFAMVLGMCPVQVWATDTDNDTSVTPTVITETYINPLYADVVTEDDLVEPSSIGLISEDVTYYTSVAEAGAAIRESLANRETTIVVGLQQETTDSLAKDIFNASIAHTGDPEYGDYIYRHCGGWECGYSYYPTGSPYDVTYSYTMTYHTSADQEANLDTIVNEIVNNCTGDTDYDKVKYIYDYLCENVTYDNTNLNDKTYKLKYSAYAALINKTAVCQGYANAFYRLALELDIDCRIISSIEEENHAWNIVQLDGKYYNVDATWDAPYAQADQDYEYFLKCDANFGKHTRSSEFASESFYAEYPMSSVDYGTVIYVAEGICGENLTWTLDEEGTLTISGEGAMHDFESAPWSEHVNMIATVIINEGVTTIGGFAFIDCANLSSLSIPDTVTSIGDNAFLCCFALTDVIIPESVTFIGDSAFAYCDALRTIVFCGNAPSVGDCAFDGVTATVTYPADNDTWTEEAKQQFGVTVTWDVAESAYPSMTMGDPLYFSIPYGEKLIYQLTVEEDGRYVFAHNYDEPRFNVWVESTDDSQVNSRWFGTWTHDGIVAELKAETKYLVHIDNNMDQDIGTVMYTGKATAPESMHYGDMYFNNVVGEFCYVDLMVDPFTQVGETITWKVSKEGIIEWEPNDEMGYSIKFNSVAPGETDLIATSESGKTVEIPVNVVETGEIGLGDNPIAVEDGAFAGYYFSVEEEGWYVISRNHEDEWYDSSLLISGSDEGIEQEWFNTAINCGQLAYLYPDTTYVVTVHRNNDQGELEGFESNLHIGKATNTESLRADCAAYTGIVGQRFYINISPDNADSVLERVTWENSNPIVGSWESYSLGYEGDFTCEEEGTTVLTASTEDGDTVSITVNVTGPNEIAFAENFEVTSENGATNYYSFVAEASGDYVFARNNQNEWFNFELHYPDGEWVESKHFYSTNYEGRISTLTEGETYVLYVNGPNESTIQDTVFFGEVTETKTLTVRESEYYGFVGQTFHVTVESNDVFARSASISWTSSDESVATVEMADGGMFYNMRLNLLSKGETTITGTASNGVTVSYVMHVEPSYELAVGTDLTLTIEPHGSIGALFLAPETADYTIWDINKNRHGIDVLTMDGEWVNGGHPNRFNAFEGDTYFVQFFNDSDETITFTYRIAKNEEVQSIYIDCGDVSGYVGDRFYTSLETNPVNAMPSDVQWQIDNESVAQIVHSDSGFCEFVLVGAGTANLTAIMGEMKPSIKITALDTEQIFVGQPKQLGMNDGEIVSYQFTAPSDGRFVLWYDNPEVWSDIVIFDENGNEIEWTNAFWFVDATAGETYRIRFQAWCGGEYKEFGLHMDEVTPVQTLSLSEESIEIVVGSHYYDLNLFTDTMTADRKDLVWSIDNESVVKFDYTGYRHCNLIAVGAGKATVTATIGDKSVSCEVTVTEPEVMVEDENYEITVPLNGYRYYRFTPKETANYTLWDQNYRSEYIEIYNANGEMVVNGHGMLQFDVEAEQAYMIRFENWSGDENTLYNYTIKKTVAPTKMTLVGDVSCFYTVEGFDIGFGPDYNPVNSFHGELKWFVTDGTDVLDILEIDGEICYFDTLKPGEATILCKDITYNLESSLKIVVQEAPELTLDKAVPLEIHDLAYNGVYFTAEQTGEHTLQVDTQSYMDIYLYRQNEEGRYEYWDERNVDEANCYAGMYLEKDVSYLIILMGENQTVNLTMSYTEPDPIRVGDQIAMTLEPNAGKVYAFTAPEDGVYVVWDAIEKEYSSLILIHYPNGNVTNVFERNEVHAEAGQRYIVEVVNPYKEEGYVGSMTMDVEIHLEKAVEATAFDLYSGQEVASVFHYYPNLPLSVTVHTKPVNATVSDLTWNIEGDDILEIMDWGTPGVTTFMTTGVGEATVTASSANLGISRSFRVVTKDHIVLNLGEDQTVELNEDWNYERLMFTPEDSGCYTLTFTMDKPISFQVIDMMGFEYMDHVSNDTYNSVKMGLEGGKTYYMDVQFASDVIEPYGSFTVRMDYTPVEMLCVGDVKELELLPGTPVEYVFEAPADGTYVVWNEGEDNAFFQIVCSDGSAMAQIDRRVIEAKAGESYVITITAPVGYNFDMTDLRNLEIHLDVPAEELTSVFINRGMHNSDALYVYRNNNFQLHLLPEPMNALIGSVSWNISDSIVAKHEQTVADIGYFQTLTGDSATVTVTADGFTDSIDVYLKDQIVLQNDVPVTLNLDAGWSVEVMPFTAHESGEYVISVDSDRDVWVYGMGPDLPVFNETLTAENNSMGIMLTEGNTYYFQAGFYDQTNPVGRITYCIAYQQPVDRFHVTNMEELNAALTAAETAEGQVEIFTAGSFIITESIEIGENTTFYINNHDLILQSGITVTNSGDITLNQGTLTVDGELINNNVIFINDGSEIIVNGTVANNNAFHVGIWKNDGAEYVAGTLTVNGNFDNYSYLNVWAEDSASGGVVNINANAVLTNHAADETQNIFGLIELNGTMNVAGTLMNNNEITITSDSTFSMTGYFRGQCGDFAEWTAHNGTLTISGEGAMYNYSGLAATPWIAYADYLTKIDVQAGITTIGNKAFSFHVNVVEVSLPSGLTQIGDSAFYWTSALEGIEIPETVTHIGEAAFYYSGIKSVVIPEGITEIQYAAFACNSNLSSVTLPNGLITIGAQAFESCFALKEIQIPDTVTGIGSWAFANTSLTSITLPASVKVLENNALSSNGMSEIYFEGDAPAFTEYALANITATAYYPADNDTWTEDVMQHYGGTITWEAYDPDAANSGQCGDNAYWYFDEDTYVLTISGEGAMWDYTAASDTPWFALRYNITGIVIEEGITAIGGHAFWNTTAAVVSIANTVTSIGENAFASSNRLTEIQIPDSVETIKDTAFNACGQLAAVTIGSGIKEIGGYAFGMIETEMIVTFTGNAPTFGERVFSEARSLTIRYPAGNDTWTEDEVLDYSGTITWVPYCTGHQEASAVIENKVDATCETDGSYDSVVYCSVCDEELSRETVVVPATGHSYGEWTTTKEATCTEKGEKRRDCKNCDHYETVEIAKKDHSYESEVTAPTCTEKGFTTHTCSVCGNSYVDTYVDAKGHTEAEAVKENEKAATCETDGSYDSVVYCSVCGEELSRETVVVPATGHNFGEWTGEGSTQTRTCSVCKSTEEREIVEFVDVEETDFFYEPVNWAVDNSITNGYGSAETFAPDMVCNRGQVVTFLWRAAGEPEPSSSVNPFTDIQESDYFYKAVLWAVEEGITSGYGSATIFNPNGSCTRGQVATFLWRYFGEPLPASNENPFNDVAPGAFYYNAVLWAVEQEITNGYGSSGGFAPDVECNRGQVVTFLYRAMN